VTPESEILRGFGFVFSGGRTRNWYVGADGVHRWADNDQPMDTAMPDRPVQMEEDTK